MRDANAYGAGCAPMVARRRRTHPVWFAAAMLSVLVVDGGAVPAGAQTPPAQ